MPKTNQPAAHSEPAPPSTALLPVPHTTEESNAMTSKLATVAAVGIGAALLEVELIPGMLLGVAAMLVPDLLPRLGNGIRPLVKGAVRAGYSVAERTKETVAEASEQLQDIVAEVRSEQNQPQTSQAPTSSSGEASQPA
ncbi:MAG TPA: DUF5132 domain-containing protein [Bryobacteraceae bacterium]|nr:DUF5132 domain-containing protein [Bryobacteraceae bacterium]